MTEYEYEQKIEQMKEFKEKLIHENSLASTDPAQIQANEWRIKWISSSLEHTRRPSAEEEQPYETFNPILESLKNKGKTEFWSPNILMSEKKS